MAVIYLALCIVLMLVGGILIDSNPTPLQYRVELPWFAATVQASVLEMVGWSMVGGAAVMAVPYLRLAWTGYRERCRLERDATALREDNSALRRDAENVRSHAKLLSARVAETEERCLQLQAEARLLLTMKGDQADGDDRPTTPLGRRLARRQPSRWQRR